MRFDRKHIRSYMKLYLVSDRHWLKERALSDDIEKAIQGGVTFVQIREKELDTEAFIIEAKKVQDVCKRYAIPFVINDNVEVAKAIDADGVHVGQHDLRAKNVRALLGEDKIIGVSAQCVEDAIQAEKDGADYLGVGAIFPTDTKADADDVSMETLKAIVEAVSIPVIAIGGIHAGNVLKLCGSGIDGVAVVSAVMAQENIYKAANDLAAQCEVFTHDKSSCL